MENNEINTKGVKLAKIFVFVFTAAVILMIALPLTNKMSKNNTDNLTNDLKQMASKYYSNYYYPEFSAGKTEEEIPLFFKSFEENGLEINLTNLEYYNNGEFQKKISEFKNSSGKACDKLKTKAIIYPTNPYGKTNFKINVKLSCK